MVQGACCSVLSSGKLKNSKQDQQELTRLSDTVLDGIYYFGGKTESGELTTKLKYLKPHCMDGKVMSADWVKLKQ
jgi:hypothetical protein